MAGVDDKKVRVEAARKIRVSGETKREYASADLAGKQ